MHAPIDSGSEIGSISREALVIVDYQKDFIEGGALGVSGAEDLAKNIEVLVSDVRAKSWIIIATRDWHPKKTVHFDVWPVHCVAGEAGSEYGAIDTNRIDVEIFKGFENKNDGYSGFEWVTKLDGDPDTWFVRAESAKTLQQVLVDSNVRVLRILGLATDYCIKATVLDALALKDAGLLDEVILEASWIAAVNLQPDDGEKALEAMRSAGATIR